MQATEQFALGIDYGTESGRVMLARVSDGQEAGYVTVPYANGVLDRQLPDGTPLGSEWALQDPRDYLAVLDQGVPQLLRQSGISGEQVVGIGVDFTSCTILPVKHDGTPLCLLPQYATRPHAWVKLWKHHAAQPQADKINRTAPEEWLRVYGGRVSSEWLLPKVLQMVEEAPELYDDADRILEGGDWLVWQLTGQERRSECNAGYKGGWVKGYGHPSPGYLASLHPKLGTLVEQKLGTTYYPLGSQAGGLTPQMAARTGLPVGTPVAVGIIDAHAAVPGCGVTEPGVLTMIMGTSLCHMLMNQERRYVEGVAGVVEDSIVPGLWGYEAGQSAVGDLYAWFFRCFGMTPDAVTPRAAALRPGESGLLALDWWNGNRSVLMNADLSGLLVGATLATQPHEIYRALIEATAFGTLAIINAFESQGIPVERLVACGGLPQKSPLVTQIFADVTNRAIVLPRSLQASELGAAMHGAVASGTLPDLPTAARQMAGDPASVYRPNAEAHRIYRELYTEYLHLHDLFGRGGNTVMQRLRELRQGAS